MAMKTTNCKNDKAFLYDSDLERKLHQSNITSLSYKFHEDINSITKIYETILERYKRQAKIKDFLSVLVFKKVQRIMRVKNKNKEIL
jgi:ABC-type molybdate transport system substrate-binding protein